MRADVAWRDDEMAGVHHSCPGSVQLLANGSDFFAINQDVGGGGIADGVVHRHQGGVLDEVEGHGGFL